MNWTRSGTNRKWILHSCIFRGYAPWNRSRWYFGVFWPKKGKKGLEMGLKCLGLVWYGLACHSKSIQADVNWKKNPIASWSEFQDSSLPPRNQTFDFAILDTLKRVLGFSHDLGSLTGKAKPYHTKLRHFRPIFGPFWPFFGPKTPKYKRERFQGA